MRRWCTTTLVLHLLLAPVAGRAAALATHVTPAAFEHGARGVKMVALTFDACTTRDPTPYDPDVVAVLEAMHVRATLFVGGAWALEEAPQLRALASNPLFEIGNHTFTHPHLTRLSTGRIRDELLRTQQAIAGITGRAPTLFRPPYGEYDDHVLRAAAEVGLTTVEYDLPSGDPDPHLSTQALIRWVLREARPGSIVVMHMNHPRFRTAEALPAIVAGLRSRGLELVTVGELLRAAPGGNRPSSVSRPFGDQSS